MCHVFSTHDEDAMFRPPLVLYSAYLVISCEPLQRTRSHTPNIRMNRAAFSPSRIKGVTFKYLQGEIREMGEKPVSDPAISFDILILAQRQRDLYTRKNAPLI